MMNDKEIQESLSKMMQEDIDYRNSLSREDYIKYMKEGQDYLENGIFEDLAKMVDKEFPNISDEDRVKKLNEYLQIMGISENKDNT